MSDVPALRRYRRHGRPPWLHYRRFNESSSGPQTVGTWAGPRPRVYRRPRRGGWRQPPGERHQGTVGPQTGPTPTCTVVSISSPQRGQRTGSSTNHSPTNMSLSIPPSLHASFPHLNRPYFPFMILPPKLAYCRPASPVLAAEPIFSHLLAAHRFQEILRTRTLAALPALAARRTWVRTARFR